MGNQLNTCCAPCGPDGKPIGGGGDMETMRKMGGKSGSEELDEHMNGRGGGGSVPSSPMDRSGSPGSTPNRDSVGNPKVFTFRSMTRTDYFELYDAIHTLVRQNELNKEEENVLYDMIGRQDKKLAAAYQSYKDSGDPMLLLEPLKARMSTRSSTSRK
mmetsp:Transcript_40717/g.101852  ORF Transcript_40717/g.101852 Transcript_40717/m.101852 type:complete len:158 (+) Transcript_40717:73-546(+)